MMGKVRWHTMMSLDGFIAGPNDDMQWAFGLDSKPSPTIEEVLRSTGALLVGRRTQDVEDRLQPGFYGRAFRGPFFVMRHEPPAEPPIVKGRHRSIPRRRYRGGSEARKGGGKRP